MPFQDAPVRIDVDACERIAEVLRHGTIPDSQEEFALPELSKQVASTMCLAAVAICHQTQALCGVIDGATYRGWDYLLRSLVAFVHAHPDALTPLRLRETSAIDLLVMCRSGLAGDTLRDPEPRASLLRDLGEVMFREGWSSAHEMYSASSGHVAASSPNLLQLLEKFRAYNDPVRKKSYFLLGLLQAFGVWSYVDPENIGPPVDYHEVRGHLRLGTVRIVDPELEKRLRAEQPVSQLEDVAIRRAVRDAIVAIATHIGKHSAMQLHYLFWNLFRSVCRRQDPFCLECPSEGLVPSRYRHFLHMHKSPRCPFSAVCPSANTMSPVLEHRFETDWY